MQQDTLETILRQERDRAQKYLDIVGVIIVVLNSDQTIALINKKGCDILGYEKEEDVLGKNWFNQFVPERVRENVKSVFDQLMAGEIDPVEYFENPVLTKSGRERIISWHNTMLTNKKGEIIGTLSSGEDITERKQTEETLQASEEKYRTVVEHSLQGLLIIQNGRIVFANKTITDITGYMKEELLNMSPEEMISSFHPEHQGLIARLIQDYRDKKILPSRYEFRALRKDGTIIWMEIFTNQIIYQNQLAVQVAILDITEHKKAKDALQESEAKFRSLAEQSPNMIFINKKGRVVYANKLCEETMGYTREEFYAPEFNFLTLIAPESRDVVMENYEKHMKDEKTNSYQYEVLTRDGRRIPVWITSKLIEFENEPAILGVVTDISEFRQMEELLRESEEKYRNLVEQNLLGIIILQDNHIIFTNQAFAKMSGFTIEELLKLSSDEIQTLIHPEDRVHVFSRMQDRLEGKSVPSQYQFRGIRKNGGIFWVETSAIIIEYKDRPAVQATLLDITERKQVEKNLRESEEKYRTLVEQSLQGIIIFQNGRIVFAQAPTPQITDYPIEEMLGLSFEDFQVTIHPEDRAEATQRFKNRLAGIKTPIIYEYRGLRKDRTIFWVEVSSNVIQYRGQPAVQIVFKNITERKQAEQLLRIQRDLGIIFNSSTDLIDAFNRSLEVILNIEGLDFGGVYLVNKSTGALYLMAHKGLSQQFISRVSHFDVDDPQTQLVMAGEPIYKLHRNLLPTLEKDEVRSQEELRFLAVIPILHEKEVVGALNIASRTYDKIASNIQHGMETIASQIGAFIVRLTTQEALRESEYKFRRFIDQSKDGIALTNEQGIIIEWSPGMERILGLKSEKILGRPLWDIVFELGPNRTPEHYKRDKTRIQELLETGKGIIDSINEIEVFHSNGTKRFLQSIFFPIKTHKGHMIGSITRDVTKRKLAAVALQKSEEKYRILVEQSLQGVVIIQDNRLVFANGSLGQFMGYTVKELMEWSLEDVRAALHPEDRAFVMGNLKARFEGKPIFPRYELRGIRKDGTIFWAEIFATLIEYQGKPAIQASLIDITERKQAEEELKNYREHLEELVEQRTKELTRINEQLQKEIVIRKQAEEQIKNSLREKEILLQEIHHRVKNNLQIISSMITLQARSVKGNPMFGLFTDIQNRVGSMALIHEKLYRSKDLTKIDVVDYIQTLTTRLARSSGLYTVRLKTEIDTISLDIDTTIYCGLIINELVSNALKHAFEDGDSGEILVKLNQNNETITLLVSDTGAGFPEGFDFQTTDSLGLQLVFTLADQLQGTVELDTKDRTTFKVTFPEKIANNDVDVSLK
ncbi:MAG: PAS domain S-box protein [Promethearchaeota archaeon]